MVWQGFRGLLRCECIPTVHDMALSITLSSRRVPYYWPGDTINGVIQLHITGTSEPCESLSIIFSGHTKVSLPRREADMVTNRRPQDSSQACLLKMSLLLESMTEIQGPGNSYWPFSFEVPTHADFTLGYDTASSGEWFSHNTPWKGTLDPTNHPIPPAMRHTSGLTCSIDYSLTARLVYEPSAAMQKRRDLSVTHDVQIRQSYSPLAPPFDQREGYVQILRRDYTLSHNKLATRANGYAERITRLLIPSVSNMVPQVGRLQLAIKIPSIIVQSDSNPVPIGLVMTLHDANVSSPLVCETSLVTELEATTHVRAGGRQQMQKTIIPLYKGTFHQIIRPLPPEGAYDDSSTRNDLDPNMGKLLRTALQKRDPVPEFATYNICRTYRLRMRLSFQAFGRRLSFRQDNIPVKIVRAETAREAAARVAMWPLCTRTICPAANVGGDTECDSLDVPPPPYSLRNSAVGA